MLCLNFKYYIKYCLLFFLLKSTDFFKSYSKLVHYQRGARRVLVVTLLLFGMYGTVVSEKSIDLELHVFHEQGTADDVRLNPLIYALYCHSGRDLYAHLFDRG